MAVRKKFAPLPRVTSKTITVGALLGKIKRLILEEPLRLDMNDWVKAFRGRMVREHAEPIVQPACGTVACMAGWGAVLLRPERGISAVSLAVNADDAIGDAIGYERPCSGGAYRDVGSLFCEYSSSYFGETGEMPRAGTPEHAAVIAKRIDTYLSQHPEIVQRKIIVADVQKALRA